MKKSVLILTGLLLSGGVAFAAWPGEGRPAQRAHRGGRGPGLGVMKQELGLSDAQVTQIEKLRADQQKAAIRRRADVQVAQLELKELMAASTVDEKAVHAQVDKISALQAANMKARVEGQLAFRKVLTPEQVQKMKELRMRPRGPRGQQAPRGRMAPGARPGDQRPGAVSDLDDLEDEIEEPEAEGPEQS